MKSVNNLKINWIGGMALVSLCLVMFLGCKKSPIVYATSDVVNITGYLDARPDSFSEFRTMLDIADDADFLSAYGDYTLFLPTNKAVDAYLQKVNKSSVKDLDPQTVKNIVDFHILQDTIPTLDFTDGKLPDSTLYGQYLITGVTNYEDGTSLITVNRQANIIQSNIRLGNGMIQVIDNVLIPAQFTLAETIAKNNRYSIFTKALKKTGLYDALDILPDDNPDSSKKWLTVLAESDSVYQTVGINSYADLKAKYSDTGNPMNMEDSLYLYMAYHILYDNNYMADLITQSSVNTLIPKEVVTPKLRNDSVLLNDATFNGVHELGIALNRNRSDVSASNGVLHDLEGNLYIKVRSPFPVYWDVCKMPEIMNKPFYGNANYDFSFEDLPDFINDDEANYFPTYSIGGNFVNGDYLAIPIGARRTPWIEFTTPLLVKGQYKVWICYRSAGNSNINQISIDSIPLQRTLNFGTYMPNQSDAELLAQGWKHYTYPAQRNWAGYLVGTIDIQTTGQHVLRITNLQGSDGWNWLDMIHFIPVGMEQTWPRFKEDGTAVNEP